MKVVSGRSGHNRVLVLSCNVIVKSAVLGGKRAGKKEEERSLGKRAGGQQQWRFVCSSGGVWKNEHKPGMSL